MTFWSISPLNWFLSWNADLGTFFFRRPRRSSKIVIFIFVLFPQQESSSREVAISQQERNRKDRLSRRFERSAGRDGEILRECVFVDRKSFSDKSPPLPHASAEWKSSAQNQLPDPQISREWISRKSQTENRAY